MSNKTIANDSSVNEFIHSITDESQQSDSRVLVKLFSDITGEEPKMWGTSLIGFGEVSMTYASGRKVDWFRAGFSPRKGKITLYVTFDANKLTSQFPNLGTFKTGKGCIYINKLSDIDQEVLKKLIQTAIKHGYGDV
jgi:hypothetical protein